MPKYIEESMDTTDSSSLPLVKNDTTTPISAAPNTQSSVDLSETGVSTNISSIDTQPVAIESPNTKLPAGEETFTMTKALITTEPFADVEKTETIPLPEHQQNDTESTSISPKVSKRGVRKNIKNQDPNPKPLSACGRGRKKVSKDTEQEVNETQLAQIPEAQIKQDYNHTALEFLLTDKSSYLAEADLRVSFVTKT
ncbi:uncharacterized protein B0P05DRAFT_520421 [Gilbertella persicaria]|uniref:uncharacterized protein n=1 Tax=Gilbertella persicaria TaxID=101096 RepID=UPI00221E7A32|nr:uncharacterized protein B0P05DRAFT_520421 [Gilbertella persicaria]KAI8098105.1 hypothetical protein B0P05DRAFT_520421 [Gilbertella persicaria]